MDSIRDMDRSPPVFKAGPLLRTHKMYSLEAFDTNAFLSSIVPGIGHVHCHQQVAYLNIKGAGDEVHL